MLTVLMPRAPMVFEPIRKGPVRMMLPTTFIVLLPLPIVDDTTPRAAARVGGLLVLLVMLTVLLAASGCEMVTKAAVSLESLKLEVPLLPGKPATRLICPIRLSWTVTVSEPLAAPKLPANVRALQLILAFTVALPGP